MGYFSRKTLKPIEFVYNYEDEKKLILSLLKGSEWFTLCGLRRTGKTTLARSVSSTVRGASILYLDMWGAKQGTEHEFFLEKLKEELEKELEKSKLWKVLKAIKKYLS